MNNKFFFFIVIIALSGIVGIYFYIEKNISEKCSGSVMPHKEVCKEGICDIVIAGEDARCEQIDETKNKLAIIIKKDGLYQNEQINNKIKSYFKSVKSDLSVDNIGVSYFNGKTVEELDNFIERLFCKKKVGYVIIVGDDMLELIGNDNKHTPLLKYASVGEKDEYVDNPNYISPTKLSIPEDRFCKDIAISVIMPPVSYSNNNKITFIAKAFENFASYHDQEVLSHYKGHLHIRWDPTVYQEGMDPTSGDKEYISENTTVLMNTDYEKILRDLGKKYYIFTAHSHGWPTRIGIGLSPNPQNDSNTIYTTLDEFRAFFSKSNSHPLIVKIDACNVEFLDFENNPGCCWPQALIEAGVWVQLSGGSTGSGKNPLAFIDTDITNSEKFLGYFIRHEKINNDYFISGDVTAYLKPQAHSLVK